MSDLVTIVLAIILSLLIIFAIKKFRSVASDEEGWYPTGTYVNTPRQIGVYPMLPNVWRGGYYNWQPYYSAIPQTRSTPYFPASQVGVFPRYAYNSPFGIGGTKYENSVYNPLVARGNPVPLDTIRWGGLFGPMLTSIKSPKDYALGQWVFAGSAFTDNPNDFTNVSVYQLNLDPGRNLFRYTVKTKNGQFIPINLQQNHDRLEDGDRFKIQGMEGKGDFVFSEADKYAYVYT